MENEERIKELIELFDKCRNECNYDYQKTIALMLEKGATEEEILSFFKTMDRVGKIKKIEDTIKAPFRKIKGFFKSIFGK